MRIKPYLPYIGIATFALVVGGLAGYLNLEHRPSVAPAGPTTTIVLLRPGRPLPAFKLQRDDGKPFARDALSGHWSLLYFGYTHCKDVCPATLADLTKMAAALKGLPPAQRPQVYFISVDPKRDSLTGLRDYVKYFDIDFSAATGSVDQLRILAKALGADFSYTPPDQSTGYTVNHSNSIMVVDPQVREVALYTPPLIASRMADDYRFIIKIQGAQP